jgi:hypothetical protein
MKNKFASVVVPVLGLAAIGSLLGLTVASIAPIDRMVSAQDPGDDEKPWFADVTDTVRLDFTHDAGDLGQFPMPQIFGSGAAIFDFDGDGRLDLYLLNNGGPKSRSTNRLYRQQADGTFKDVTDGSGLGIAGHNMGVAIGDVNNDGLPDVLVTQYRGIKLFLNRGNGKFEDVTEQAGLNNADWATSASFFDYDRDGFLDLVVVNYVDYDPKVIFNDARKETEYPRASMYPGTVTRLFRNLGSVQGKKGEPVRFQDVTVAAGFAKFRGPGLGVYCADFNGDGWPDIFVANDGKPNHLWINQKDGTFREEAVSRGLAVDALGLAHASGGVAVGDCDNDGLFDLFGTHRGPEGNVLWSQAPRGEFRDRTAGSGLLKSQWRGSGFGTVMADFNHDGWLDIAVVNGRDMRGTATPNEKLGEHFKHYGERNQLFRNEGQGKFRDVSAQNRAFCGTPNVARALVRGDLDGDGAEDLLVTTVANRARIYRNVAPGRGHWLRVQALDPRLKRDAYGAEVTVQAGGRRWLRIINPGDSYLCSSDPRAHFGLDTSARYDAIHVRWPDGLIEQFGGGAADRVLAVRRGEGKAVEKIE